MLSKNLFSKALTIIGACLFSSFFANASLTSVDGLLQVSILITGGNNDCKGYFNQGFGPGFEECKITHVPSGNSPIFAEIMGKFGLKEDGSLEDEFVAPSKASDWNFDVDSQKNQAHPGDNGTGQWHYTGTAYPGISFWVAKASNDFILNWMIADNTENVTACTGNEFSINCLQLAVSVTTGAWTTPLGPHDVPRDLSHISFYGKKCEENCKPKQQVPEPTSIVLLALALFGLATKRKKFSL